MTNKASCKWDYRFFSMCDLVSSWSEDPSRKVGCVIVEKANVVLATGYNGLPRGVDGSISDRFDRDTGEKYIWFEHAERNAIFNAARVGVSLQEAVLYCNSFPCAHCARAIIQSGIKVVKTFSYNKDDPKFGKEFPISETMFREASVELQLFNINEIYPEL